MRPYRDVFITYSHKLHAESMGSDQLQPLETDIAILADDDVVMHRDAERFGGADDHLCHVDIRARRGRVAGRVVVERPT